MTSYRQVRLTCKIANRNLFSLTSQFIDGKMPTLSSDFALTDSIIRINSHEAHNETLNLPV